MNLFFKKSSRLRPLLLHIDDDEDAHEWIETLGSRLKCDVIPAYYAAQGIALAKKRGPNLILLDYQMPGTNGVETCQALKTDPTTKKIPVIMLTSVETTKEVDKAFQAGANDYIIKPVTIERLQAKLHPIINGPDSPTQSLT